MATTILKSFTVALIGALAMSAAALADPNPSTDAANSSDPVKLPDVPSVTTGSINLDTSPEQRMKDCMAIWEPRTHMTKQQWRRTCKTTMQEFVN